MVNIQKCAIIGCGSVGATTAFSLVESGLFSEMVLLDLDEKKAAGEAMDLNHSIPFSKPLNLYNGCYQDIKDCSLVIVTAGANQKPDETRMDLIQKNVAIFKDIIPKVAKVNQEGILMIVSNPVDVLTYAALKLSGFPPNRVIGSGTVLDTARLKHLLGEHLHVDSRCIHAFIIGEHGDSELAVWSSANVSGINLSDFCKVCGQCINKKTMHSIYKDVRDSAYQIIANKGATYYGIAAAVRRIAECIVRDEHSVLPVTVYLDSHYQLHNICLSVPAIVGSLGIERILDICLSEEEQKMLINSAGILQEAIIQTGL